MAVSDHAAVRRSLVVGIGASAGVVMLGGAALSLQACGGGDDGTAPPTPVNPDTTAPVVAAVFPVNGAETSDLATVILATFSEIMDASTLTPSSFRLTLVASGAALPGLVSVSGKTSTFTPAAPLAPGTQYQVSVAMTARDLAGNSLASDFAWLFSTAAAALVPMAGAHGLGYKNNGILGRSVTVDLGTTQAARSTLLACVGRGVIGSHRVPTDNKANQFLQIDSAHTYVPRWPNSGTALYASTHAAGGANHVVTADNDVTPTDEVTLAVVEVRNGGSVNARWNQAQAGDPIESLTITTTGPATLVAFWWGDADGSVAHTVMPGNGFTRVDAVLLAGSLVQCAVATREVFTAGTYGASWISTPQQGAQLWLVAVQSSP